MRDYILRGNKHKGDETQENGQFFIATVVARFYVKLCTHIHVKFVKSEQGMDCTTAVVTLILHYSYVKCYLWWNSEKMAYETSSHHFCMNHTTSCESKFI